jgi:hypothetical protein
MAADLVLVAAPNLIDRIEQLAALLASELSPLVAAQELRRMADDLEEMQPEAN